MRRFLIALVCVIALTASGFVGAEIREHLELPYEQGSLSGITFVRGDTAYMKFFSGLSTIDSTFFWNDLIILRDMGISKIHLYINSPGGSAFTGICLADQIIRAQSEGFKITAYASGIIASAAVPVFGVCNVRYAAPGTIFMVHEASIWKWPGRETASDIESQSELMHLLRERYITKLVEYSNLTKEEWREMEKKTTWFSAEKALEWGLVDEIK